MRFSKILVSAALVTLAFAGCNDDPPFYLFACTTSADCATGSVCENNVCVTPGVTGGDTGTDATSEDTTSEDTSVGDDVTTMDATPSDTSTTDTSRPDVNVRDTSTPDTSRPDVSEPDTSCVPSCGERECGGDGCGGVCGTCGASEACNEGLCISTERYTCEDLVYCFQACEDEACANDCQSLASDEALNLYIAAVQCVQDNCAEVTSEDEAIACQSEFCSNELNACFAG